MPVGAAAKPSLSAREGDDLSHTMVVEEETKRARAGFAESRPTSDLLGSAQMFLAGIQRVTTLEKAVYGGVVAEIPRKLCILCQPRMWRCRPWSCCKRCEEKSTMLLGLLHFICVPTQQRLHRAIQF